VVTAAGLEAVGLASLTGAGDCPGAETIFSPGCWPLPAGDCAAPIVGDGLVAFAATAGDCAGFDSTFAPGCKIFGAADCCVSADKAEVTAAPEAAGVGPAGDAVARPVATGGDVSFSPGCKPLVATDGCEAAGDAEVPTTAPAGD
jgi:hypothetical protein